MKTRAKNIYYAAVVSLLFLVSGCAVTDIDRTADFHKYRTFAWGEPTVQVDDPVYKSKLIDKNIRWAVENEFAKRGITKHKRNPDFIVSYQIVTKEKQETVGGPGFIYGGYPFFPFRYYPYSFGWGWGMPYFYDGWGAGPRMRDYTEGTLIIDITDNKTDELVWRGTVKGHVDNLAALQKQIQKGIRAIMKKYPISPSEQPSLLRDEKPVI